MMAGLWLALPLELLILRESANPSVSFATSSPRVNQWSTRQIAGPLLDSKLNGAWVAAIVTDLSGKVLFQQNADQRMIPASNQKIFTCAYVLAKKGAEYQTKTTFQFASDSIMIQAEGDPTLSSEKVRALAPYVRPENRRSVIVNQNYRVDRPDTWQIGDSPNRYAPAIHAFSVDRAGFELWWNRDGLSFRPHKPLLSDQSFVLLAGQPAKIDYDVYQGKLRVTGEAPINSARLDTLSDPDPSATAINVLLEAADAGVEKQSVPHTEVIPAPPVSKLIADCLKPSDNCLAEHLLMIGSGKRSHPEAARSMSEWLTQTVQLDPKSIRVADGSGISRKNTVTARTVANMLRWCYWQPTRHLWQDSLATAGSGTLAKRLGSITFFGKTGTLDMVSALSGYVKCKDGQTRIVSVILNQYSCSDTEARNLMDRFIENVSNI